MFVVDRKGANSFPTSQNVREHNMFKLFNSLKSRLN